MQILVLDPGKQNLRYTLMGENQEKLVTGIHRDYRFSRNDWESLLDICGKIAGKISSVNRTTAPDAIAIRVLYGGEAFEGPLLYGPETDRRLAALAPESPMNIPVVRMLAKGCGQVFPDVPVLLVFETGFFQKLPARERFYAISPDAVKDRVVRRYGFQGILHEEAARQASVEWRKAGKAGAPRVFSVCLEPRSETAAISGMRPLAVKGGATPMEGLLGETSIGDTDPGIMIQLSDELKWGPERINRMLTEESGIFALSGERLTLGDVFTSDREECRKVRRIFRYQLLIAAGAAIAAMGGLDRIVFSGRYRECGAKIGPWLQVKLGFLKKSENGGAPSWRILSRNRESVIAALAQTALLENRMKREELREAV